MTRHHPGDDLLLELAAGRLRAAMALVVDVHVDGCAPCRERVQLLNAIGGALIDEGDPHPLAPGAWARALERIDGAKGPTRRPSTPTRPSKLRLPEGVAWPHRLDACRSTGWTWMGPGRRFARLELPEDPQAKLFLLRIGPGRSLPVHTHDGAELTQVLTGTFDDGRDTFGPGDFDATDEAVSHQPVVRRTGECVCLAYVGGRLRFQGRVAELIGGWVGM